MRNRKCKSDGGYVYIAWAKGTRWYKIGYSQTPWSRLKNMQTGSPVPLELVHKAFYADPAAEKKIHEGLNAYRLHGEWFDLTTRQMVDDLIVEMEKFAAGETSCFDGCDGYVKKPEIHRRKGNRWIKYTCRACQKILWTGNESQSAVSKMCYPCWKAEIDLVNKIKKEIRKRS